MKKISFLLFILLLIAQIYAQPINYPTIQAKSHQTMSIIKVDFRQDETVFHMRLVNRIKEGADFCVDKNVKIVSDDFEGELKMIRSENIENCPNAYHFTKLNEPKSFQLFFPPLPKGVREIDLIEDCSDNCFTVKGIVLDRTLDSEMKNFDKALALYSKNDFQGALPLFTQIRDNSQFTDRKHYGYSIYIIPLLYNKIGDKPAAKNAFKKLKEKDFANKDYFIEQLKKIDYFKNL